MKDLIIALTENNEINPQWDALIEKAGMTCDQVINNCDIEQAQAMFPIYEQHRAWFNLEDRIVELMGEDEGYEWIEANQ